LLGADLVFVIVFLVYESYGDILGVSDCKRVSGVTLGVVERVELDVADGEEFGAAAGSDAGVFATSTSEEKGCN
jgi:hypothetical protein